MSNIINSGIIASPGIRIGKAYVYKGDKIIIPKYMIKDEEIESELDRLNIALDKTKKEITEIQEQIAISLSDDMADIFTSHLMVLEDPLISDKAV
jgi:phosphotransferase system enzyme I (PtsI)